MHITAACKEVSVRYPGASGFYLSLARWASESFLGKFLVN